MFALLASHSRLSMVRRTNLWRWFYGRFGDLADPANLQRAVATMSRYQRFEQLDPDWDRITSEFAVGPPSYGRLFELLNRHHAERVGKPRWGDKSLHTEHYADDVFREFPDARMIQLIRDPRDRYASIANRNEVNKGIGAATGRWLASVQVGRVNSQRYADRYRMVRFEDLARDPVGVLERVCSFIGEPYEEEMLAMRGAPEHGQGNSSFGQLAPGSISTKPIGRFREALAGEDVAFIQRAAGRRMAAHGYSLEPVEMSGGQRRSFAVRTLPVTYARMAGWRVTDHVRRRRESVPEQRMTAEAQT